jgi:hypothetical protein
MEMKLRGSTVLMLFTASLLGKEENKELKNITKQE